MAPSRRLRIRFRGRSVELAPGETLLQALLSRGLPLLQRSIRYHRPRAPFCGVGHCSHCLVRVNGAPNVRSCRYLPSEGDQVRTENAWPSPAFDFLGALDFLFPRGMDTTHGFRRPLWAQPLFHRVVRRLAGYGRPPDGAPPREGVAGREVAEVLVIGAGPAGRAAAARAAREGRRVLLVDRGGIAAAPPGIEARPGLSALFLPPRERPGSPFRLLASRSGAAVTVEAPRVILTPGAYDGSLLFAGNDRPGVMTAEGALAFRDRGGEPPFRRALLVGGGLRAAELVERFGPRLGAVVAPGRVHGAIATAAADLELPVYPRTLLLSAEGRSRVRRARLRRRGSEEPFSLDVDAVVLAHRRLPNAQLFFQVGAAMHWRGGGGAYYPTLTNGLSTTVEGVYAAGEAAGFADPVAVEASGVAAAEAALGHGASLSSLPARLPEEGPHELEGYYRELLGAPPRRGKTILCGCEDVLLGELAAVSSRGLKGIEVAKRYTGVGTGICQGRYCIPEALLLLSLWERRPPSEVGYITQRPPVEPVALGTLAALPVEDSA